MELINYLTLVVSNSSHFVSCDGSQRVSNHLSPMSPTPNEIITVSAPVKKCWRGNTIQGMGSTTPSLSLYILFLQFTFTHKHSIFHLLPEMYMVLQCSRSLYASSKLSARLSERTKRKKSRKVILIYSTGGLGGTSLHRKHRNKGSQTVCILQNHLYTVYPTSLIL